VPLIVPRLEPERSAFRPHNPDSPHNPVLTRGGSPVSIHPNPVEEPMPLSAGRRSDLLAACQLFRGIGAEGLATLANVTTEVSFPAGHVIARQGEIGTGFFVVVDGAVRVVRDGSVLAHLGPGDFFGELSVLDGRPRNAMVSAESATTCVAIASWDFEAALLANPAVTLAILRGVATRLREATDAPRH